MVSVTDDGPLPAAIVAGEKEGLQTAICCPCGNEKILALGLCATCYVLKRQDAEYFGGLREQVLERDGKMVHALGDVLGHEFMGVVEEVGKNVTNLRRGDRVVVPFTIACGNCLFCKKKIWAACDNSNPNAHLMEAAYGYSGSGLFGYSHMMGGYAGGQAQYARVPFANVGPLKIESDLPDEKVLFLSDIFPTGYMAAENAQIQPGDTVAVWAVDRWGSSRSPARSCLVLQE
jgi:threonine dehydrogenase-like Zn-dependent dehydrogenase